MTSNDEWTRDQALRLADEIIAAEERGRQSVLARLQKPDKALVEAVCEAMEMCDNPYCSETLGRTAIAALATVLAVQDGE